MGDDFSNKHPYVAVDVVLLTIHKNELKAGLILREDEPGEKIHALPGRFVRYDEKIEDTVYAALKTKGQLEAKDLYIEQLYTFGQTLDRDTRVRTISVIYFCVLSAEDLRKHPNSFLWTAIDDVPALAFDHAQIIDFAIERIREQLYKTDIIFRFMPCEFTLTELQQAYEVILAEELDKRNFRKKMKELFVLEDTKKTKMDGPHRPAKLYRFAKKNP